ncbi:MAG: hypothetical protein IPI00_08340 [Flavobacteriales bacterium]|nr:hypothetical protein [Flavobacteriales bacterium]MBK6943967.1 hypothetical protein [Flavobacteriales bacterium]MBK7240174.1 hypothetical protein [Flavobacteriales bacterium]MBK7297857.1 hypothetical protein [Flavobacteriales bacterium]MBK9533638.1 hypothetical protein [Flavobacteriales bacterium]
MRAFVSRYPVLLFVLLTLSYQFVVVGVVWAKLAPGTHISNDEVAHMIFRFRVFGPLVFAVMITAYLEGMAGMRKLFGAFFHWKVSAIWYALAFLWKPIFTYIGITTIAILGIRAWPGFVVDDFFGGSWENLGNLMKNMPFIVGIAFVEETAWMKFSVTRLQDRYKALPACLLAGTAWGLWYLPMLLIGEGVPDGYPWHMFMLSMIALTFFLSWTYNMTRSGTILLIMQIISNCAFFMLPVLPGLWGGDPTYINGFVSVNMLSAIAIVVIFGWREMGRTTRAKWSDLNAEVDPEQDSEKEYMITAA